MRAWFREKGQSDTECEGEPQLKYWRIFVGESRFGLGGKVVVGRGLLGRGRLGRRKEHNHFQTTGSYPRNRSALHLL
jgi:hypothetical protein